MANDKEVQLVRQAMAAGITSRKELANFMAQVSHESGGLVRLEEGFRYTKGIHQIPVKSALREGPEALEAARISAQSGKPEALAELMYGGRMGNEELGDGYAYRGRGYMQLTGKDNYRAAGTALNLDLVNHPNLAGDPENAAKIATWFWKQNVPLAAREDVTATTRAINGGTNGLADRETRYADWYKTLTPEFIEQVDAGRVGLSQLDRTATQSAPARNVSVSSTLSHGERGIDVRHVQDRLCMLGFRDARGRKIAVDGDFGQRTKEVVQAFQHAHGLKADGVVGTKTLDALKKAEHAPLVSDPNHPDHILYQQALKGIAQLPANSFRKELERQNAAATLAFEAKVGDLKQIDHVVVSTNGHGLFAVQGRIDDPAHHRVFADKAQAASQPVEQSTLQLQQETQRHEQAQPQAPTREPRMMLV